MKKLTREKRTVFVGVTDYARKLGVSHTHLRHILNGDRKAGTELRKKLEAEGYTFNAKGRIEGTGVL